MKEKLRNKAPEMVGGLGPAIRLVMEQRDIREKFSGVCPELEEMSVSRLEITDLGLQFVCGE